MHSAVDDYLAAFGPAYQLPDDFYNQELITNKAKPQSRAHTTAPTTFTHKPRVQQEDTYDGYVKPKEAFSATDGYQYAL